MIEDNDIKSLEQFEIGKKALNEFGSFPALLFWRIKCKKLFPIIPMDSFPEELLKFFVKSAKEASNDPDAIKNIHSLVNLFPSHSTLKKLIKAEGVNNKSSFFYKLAIDILSFYYRTTGGPLYKKYRKEVLPFALQVFEAYSEVLLLSISQRLSSYNKKSIQYLFKN